MMCGTSQTIWLMSDVLARARRSRFSQMRPRERCPALAGPDRADRRGMVETFGGVPRLPAILGRLLQVAACQVVAGGVTEDVSECLLGSDVDAAAADRDYQLDLVMEVVVAGGYGIGAPLATTASAGFMKNTGGVPGIRAASRGCGRRS